MADHYHGDDPVGVVEIAELLGTTRNTVDSWRRRHQDGFPAPEWTVGGRPAWRWSDIAAWHNARTDKESLR